MFYNGCQAVRLFLTIHWPNVQKNFSVHPMNQAFYPVRQNCRPSNVLLLLLTFGLLITSSACRTVPPFTTVDFTRAGWKIKSGQAIWKVKKDAPEIAGELTFASNPNGRTVLQMTKTPFPMAIAQLQADKWQIEFPTENRTYSGRGEPPKRLAWLHLAKALKGEKLLAPWKFEQADPTNWRLENLQSGEVIEGFLQ